MNIDKVLELAREAELARQFALEVPFVVDRLERFAALIEREVREDIDFAINEWLDKTEWVQKRRDWPFPPYGMHRADVMRRYIEHLEAKSGWDAQPVGYTNEGYKGMQYANAEAYKEIHPDFIQRNKLTAPLFAHPTPAASAESVASVHIKDGCLIGSQRKSGVDIPDGQYALYPIGTSPTPAVVRQLVDGLAGLIDFIEIDNLKIDQDAFRIAKAALATAKANGL